MNPPRHWLALEAAALCGPGSDAHLDALCFGIPCALHDAHESRRVRAQERARVQLRKPVTRARHTAPAQPCSQPPKPAHDEARMRLLGMN